MGRLGVGLGVDQELGWLRITYRCLIRSFSVYEAVATSVCRDSMQIFGYHGDMDAKGMAQPSWYGHISGIAHDDVDQPAPEVAPDGGQEVEKPARTEWTFSRWAPGRNRSARSVAAVAIAVVSLGVGAVTFSSSPTIAFALLASGATQLCREKVPSLAPFANLVSVVCIVLAFRVVAFSAGEPHFLHAYWPALFGVLLPLWLLGSRVDRRPTRFSWTAR